VTVWLLKHNKQQNVTFSRNETIKHSEWLRYQKTFLTSSTTLIEKMC
jgi:hypothetical protein